MFTICIINSGRGFIVAAGKVVMTKNGAAYITGRSELMQFHCRPAGMNLYISDINFFQGNGSMFIIR